jgi:hypothetical protein
VPPPLRLLGARGGGEEAAGREEWRTEGGVRPDGPVGMTD